MSHIIPKNGKSRKMSYKYMPRDRKPGDVILSFQDNNSRNATEASVASPTTCSKFKRTRLIQLVLAGVGTLAVIAGLALHLVNRNTARPPKLLIVSFDGLRWNYPDIYHLEMPNFNQFAFDGVRAEKGIKPCFSTETFPNHFSLATGLFEETHGIVSNSMYDPLLNQSFSLSNPLWFQGGDPLWTTASRQHLTSGVYFWLGGEHEIRGLRPDYHAAFNLSVDYQTRIDTVLSWFVDHELNLGMLYLEQPDMDGHSYGIFTERFKATIKDVDRWLGYLLYRMDELHLKESLNLIVLGDHGMVNKQERIVLENYIDLRDVHDFEGHSMASGNLFPAAGREKALFAALQGAHPNLTVYRKADVPDRLHYQRSPRIAPLVLVADLGYIIAKRNKTPSPHIGYHGYDNAHQDMQAFFAAQGPAFKAQLSVQRFNNVDVYPLACKILGITPSPNNGTMDTVRHLLLRP